MFVWESHYEERKMYLFINTYAATAENLLARDKCIFLTQQKCKKTFIQFKKN